jgi:hypothetical protein
VLEKKEIEGHHYYLNIELYRIFLNKCFILVTKIDFRKGNFTAEFLEDFEMSDEE